ncbi:hypothetical protein GX50_08253 [[Emmonsia] crescens]|uniref:Uncharacterized protein n=1 Tax=[Emmonsia] crescens TaxID=73230 RepID=A0A2B7Z707_9EURO|nr:hypothetical protein GX50_08253 [Emmonsia crescens]
MTPTLGRPGIDKTKARMIIPQNRALKTNNLYRYPGYIYSTVPEFSYFAGSQPFFMLFLQTSDFTLGECARRSVDKGLPLMLKISPALPPECLPQAQY